MAAALTMDAQPQPQPADADAELLGRWARAGDRQALGDLFARHAEAAFALAWRRLGHASDAEDAVQAGFLAAMRGARSHRGGSVRGWLLACVLNACRMQARSTSRRRAFERAAASPPPREEAEPSDVADAVRACLSHLPDHQREPIELRFLAQLEFADIASALRRPEKTVRGQVDRGLQRMRGELARIGYTGSVVAALGTWPSPPSAGADLAGRLARMAHSGGGVGTVGGWIIAGMVAAAAAIAALAWPESHGRQPMVAVPSVSAPSAMVMLDTPVRLVLRHSSNPIGELLRALPVDQRFAVIVPFVSTPWEGVTWPPRAEAGRKATVRQALDAIAAQCQLHWRQLDDAVIFSRQLDADDRERWRRQIHDLLEADTEETWAARCDQTLLSAAAADPDALADALLTVVEHPRREEWQERVLAGIVIGATGSSYPQPPSMAPALRGDQRVEAAAAQLLAAPKPPAWAVLLAGHLRLRTSYARLIELTGGSSTVAGEAYTALGMIGDARAIPGFEAAIHEGLDLCAPPALRALAQVAGATAAPTLARAADDARLSLGVRSAAIVALGGIPGAEASASIRRHLGLAGEPQLAIAAMMAVRAHGDSAAAAEVRPWTKSGDGIARAVAAETLGWIGNADDLEDLLATDLDAGELAGIIAEMRDPRVVARLAGHLADTDEGRAKAAALALAASPLPGAGASLNDARTRTADPRRRALLEGACLGSTDDDLSLAAIGRFSATVKAEDDETLACFVDSSGTVHAQGVLDRALSLVRDDADPRVRSASLRFVTRDLGVPGVMGLAWERVRRDPHARVRAAAVAGLGDEKQLIAVLAGDPHPFVRAAAVRAMRDRIPADPGGGQKCDGMEARAALLAAAEHDPDPRVRCGALTVLTTGQWAEREPFIAVLIRLVHDPEPSVRCISAWELARAAREAMDLQEPADQEREALVHAARDDEDSAVRRVASIAARIASGDGGDMRSQIGGTCRMSMPGGAEGGAPDAQDLVVPLPGWGKSQFRLHEEADQCEWSGGIEDPQWLPGDQERALTPPPGRG